MASGGRGALGRGLRTVLLRPQVLHAGTPALPAPVAPGGRRLPIRGLCLRKTPPHRPGRPPPCRGRRTRPRPCPVWPRSGLCPRASRAQGLRCRTRNLLSHRVRLRQKVPMGSESHGPRPPAAGPASTERGPGGHCALGAAAFPAAGRTPAMTCSETAFSSRPVATGASSWGPESVPSLWAAPELLSAPGSIRQQACRAVCTSPRNHCRCFSKSNT